MSSRTSCGRCSRTAATAAWPVCATATTSKPGTASTKARCTRATMKSSSTTSTLVTGARRRSRRHQQARQPRREHGTGVVVHPHLAAAPAADQPGQGEPEPAARRALAALGGEAAVEDLVGDTGLHAGTAVPNLHDDVVALLAQVDLHPAATGRAGSLPGPDRVEGVVHEVADHRGEVDGERVVDPPQARALGEPELDPALAGEARLGHEQGG